jgi:hypothetical protein
VVHLPRHLAEPHHVGPHGSFATSTAGSLHIEVLASGRARPAGRAKRPRELAILMDEIARSRGLRQPIDILGDSQNIVGMLALQPRQSRVCSIRPRVVMPPPVQVIEVMHSRRVAGEAFRSCHLLEWKLRPQPSFVANVPSSLSAESPAQMTMRSNRTSPCRSGRGGGGNGRRARWRASLRRSGPRGCPRTGHGGL